MIQRRYGSPSWQHHTAPGRAVRTMSRSASANTQLAEWKKTTASAPDSARRSASSAAAPREPTAVTLGIAGNTWDWATPSRSWSRANAQGMSGSEPGSTSLDTATTFRGRDVAPPPARR